MKAHYAIKEYFEDTQRVIITVRDIIGNKHELNVSADGLMNHELNVGFVQDNFPELSSDERELLITGIPGSTWDEMFKDENEDL